jgi:hypothetical protein
MVREKKEKTEKISGWYPKSIAAPRELPEEEVKRVDEWFDRLIKGNYKRLSAEVPGKMMLALGKLALEKGVPFTDFIEGILREYLERQGIDWQGS